MNVLMTIGQLNIGGAERRLLQLATELRRLKVDVRLSFYIVSGKAGVFDQQFKELGVELIYGRPGLLGLVKFWRICNSLKPDIFHANSGTAGGFYCLAARLARVEFRISHIRSAGPRKTSVLNRHTLLYEPLTGIVSDLVVGVSRACAERQRFPRRKWRVVYDGVEAPSDETFSKLSLPRDYILDGVNFLILGRIDRLKNINHAIRAFSLYCSKFGGARDRLHVVGPEGNQNVQELREIAIRFGVVDQVVFHGRTDMPFEHLVHATCVLLPSDYEGLPGVVIESLSCGTPVVASDILPCREISERTSGVMVVPVLDIEGWARSMFEAISADREKIKRDFRLFSPFSIQHNAKAILGLWRDGKSGRTDSGDYTGDELAVR